MRLRGYSDFEKTNNIKLQYIVTAPLSNFHKQYFEILEIPLVSHESFCAERLLVCERRRVSFLHSNESIVYLRDQIFKKLGIYNVKQEKLIYISRSKAKCRRVENEEKLIDFLSSKGFESYNLELMSVAEQVRIFSKAKVIISPHGAGLANLIFAVHPVLIELVPFDNPAWGAYENLCYTMGGIYRQVSARVPRFKINVEDVGDALCAVFHSL